LVGTSGASPKDDTPFGVFKTMSSRSVEMLKEDTEALGPMRARDVARAQQEIIEAARQLEADGKIVLKSEGQDEYIV
jgi:flagellar motor switch protein FliG